MAAATAALAILGFGGTAAAAQQAAHCHFASGSHALRISIARDPKREGRSGSAYVGVRRRFVYVFAGEAGDRVPCTGASPTTLNIEAVFVDAAPRLRSVELVVDQRGGVFAPGNTDEGDGSSEVEWDIDLGNRGLAYFLMTQGDDAVSALDLGDQTIADLNAFETHLDLDVSVRGAGLIVLGLGGNDLLSAVPPAPGPYDPYSSGPPTASFGIGLLGGAGADGLFGSPAADALVGGGGADFVAAGDGNDAIGTSDMSADVIDCGAGQDRLTSDKRDRAHACERRGGSAAAARATRLPPGVAPDQLPLRLRAR